MPVLSLSESISNAVSQAIAQGPIDALSRNATNSTAPGIEVVCAWPVSGQYGPGSRMLYYVLIAACVLARKAEWIKNACLAAALLLPAVAALHGIVLAAFHREGAVDMDIYGAFQLCAIGILAAPVTVRLSKTYFNDPGRNTIFLWAGLILAGLLGLTVEFYRAQSTWCATDDKGIPISPDPNKFPYDAQPMCGMHCTTDDDGPKSPMRGGAQNNIYVIPAPSRLTFGTATLLSAACCVHAVLWLVSMMDKILELNWKSRFGIHDDLKMNEPIEGTNGATVGKMKSVNETVRFFLSVAVVPLFTAAGLAVLIIGETNFFSAQVRYMNEPMASIGQWGPIVGTGIAIMGSLYLLLVADIEAVMHDEKPEINEAQCNCCHRQPPLSPTSRPRSPISRVRGSESIYGATFGIAQDSNVGYAAGAHHQASRSTSTSLHESDTQDEIFPVRSSFSMGMTNRLKRHISGQSAPSGPRHSSGEGSSRHRVARALVAVGDSLGTATHDSFDVSEFRDGPALEFPEIPGERERNENLARVKEIYSLRMEPDGTPAVQAPRSRAGSFIGANPSGGAIDSPRLSREVPRRSSEIPSRSASPGPASAGDIRPRASTMPIVCGSYDPRGAKSSPPVIDPHRGRERRRRDTLEVPTPEYFNHPPPSNPSTPGP